LGEADRLCDLHLKVRDSLCNDVVQQVKTWQKDAYHKVDKSCYSIFNTVYFDGVVYFNILLLHSGIKFSWKFVKLNFTVYASST
jgi:hypothetical protein